MTEQADGTAQASDRLAGIVAFARELAAKPGFELASVMDLVVERAQALTGAEGASLSLLDEGDLIVRAAAGISTGALNEVIPQTSASWSALSSGRSILIEDTASDDRIYEGLRRRFGEHSLVCAPVFHGERAIGVLHLISSAAGERLGDDDRHTLELFAVVLSSALSQAAELRAQQEQVGALARFAAIFELAPIGIIRVDADGRPVEANPALERMLGYSAEELSTMNFREYTHPDDIEHNIALFRDLIEGRRDGYKLEKRSFRKDGELIWTEVTAAREPSPDGGTMHAVSMIEDVTDRKRAEAERAETHALLDSIVDHVPGLLWVKDSTEFRFARVSRSFCEMFGLPEEEIVGKTDYDLTPEAADRFRQSDLDVLASRGRLDVGEEELVNSRGETRVLYTIKVPILAEEGRPLYVLGYAEDITERVEAERARRVVQQRFDAMAESIDEAFWMADLDTGQVLYANPAFARIWGVTQEEALANAAIRVGLVHRDDRERFFAQWEQIDRGFDLEYRIVQPGGEERWVRDRVFHAEREGGRLVLGISRDITDRVHERDRAREETERRDAERRMSQKLEAVGQLAAGIAHEINTPIQFVGDSVQFLDDAFGDVTKLVGEYRELVEAVRRGETVAADAVERVEQAEEDADLAYLLERVPQAFSRTFDGISRVTTIVRAMKAFAHPDTSEQAPADLNEALETTLVVATNEYKYVADVELDLGEIPAVVCHLGDLNQVFLNLVVNAAHAIAEHSKISGERGLIRVASERAGDHVLVSISDTGGGIPDGIRNRIFDPFFTTKEVGRGTGQGLAMARSVIVDKHHGSLEVDSQIGRGSTFRISLPISGKDAMEARAA